MLLTLPITRTPDDMVRPLTGSELNYIIKHLDGKPITSLRETGIETLMRLYSIDQNEAYRICILLDRDIMLMQLLEECSALGIDVTTPFDEGYPARIKKQLGGFSAPPLFFFGDIDILTVPCAGFTGASGIKTPDMVKDNIKTLIPALGTNGFSLITSGGHGACFHARKVALEQGTRLVTVMNGHMCDYVSEEQHRANAEDGSELILSPYNPFTPFDPDAQALVNRIIYCQSLAAFAATVAPKNSEHEAVRKKYCPYLYAFDTPENQGLISRGFVAVSDTSEEWVASKASIWYDSHAEQLSFL